MTTDEPPWARKGIVMPVSGMSAVTPPATTNTWIASTADSPWASSEPNGSGAISPARKPRATRSA